MGKVRAVCISEKRGTQKKNIESAVFVENWGIEEDAHAGNWHRQISLLSEETIAAFKARGAVKAMQPSCIVLGEFGQPVFRCTMWMQMKMLRR